MESRRRYKRFGLVFLLLLAVLVGSLGWLTYREIRQEKLNRALIAAIKQDDTETVLDLLDQGANPNAREEAPQHLSLWQMVLDKFRGKHPARSTAPTALLTALEWHVAKDPSYAPEFPPENLRLIKALLDKGAEVNVADRRGNTPLLFAVMAGGVTDGGRDKTINLLLDHGADVNPHTRSDITPLMWAVMGPDTGEAVITRIVKQGADVNAHNRIGDTALMFAVQNERLHVVQLLLQHHANPNSKNSDGITALRLAIENHIVLSPSVNRQIVQILKQAGAKE